MAEVGFHGLDGEVELLGDLPVSSADLGELGDGRLLWAEVVGSSRASAPASSPPLGPRAVGMPTGSACLSDVKRLSEQRPRPGDVTAAG